MIYQARPVLLLMMLFLSTGCLGPVRELYPEEERQRPNSVYVISQGWHVGIAFKSRFLRKKLPEHSRIPDTDFLMVGWGDNKYYPADRAGIGLFLRAAFWPTGSVIHLVGFDEIADEHFIKGEVVRVRVSQQGMEEMTDHIADRFRTADQGTLFYAADGLYPQSAFFEAKGRYYFPKTSNKWSARVLRESGFPITPFYALTSGNVIRQARKSGEVLQ